MNGRGVPTGRMALRKYMAPVTTSTGRRIPPETYANILALKAIGWSNSRIALNLRMSRDLVSRCIEWAMENGFNPDERPLVLTDPMVGITSSRRTPLQKP
ncbi:hypothetical protein N7493_010872 [Penicillium malachiteum]|uniref:Uncharacterized protein n=1 Tax=Penicillium malachiteum TaxID=1324776 RepID=A0AAD6HB93_9EURO|nr:hypothetical protein N7493_010872 [Penicillium malachiteum]